MKVQWIALAILSLLFVGCEDEPIDAAPPEITCVAPTDLTISPNVGGRSLYWDHPGAQIYTVEFGFQGFTLGTGQEHTTSDQDFTRIPLEGGQAYDFYVKAFCSSADGESVWAGPFAYFNDDSQNLCEAPINLEHFILGSANPFGAEVSWDSNGEFEFEVAIGSQGANPDQLATENVGASSTIAYTDLNQNTDYDFYVRGICANGETTDWAGPMSINIGG